MSISNDESEVVAFAHASKTHTRILYLSACPAHELATMIMCGLLIIWRLCSRYICRLFGRFLGRRLVHRFFLFISAILPSKTSSGFPQNSPTMATPHAMFSIESRSGREVDGLLRYGSSTGVCQIENGRTYCFPRVVTRLIVVSAARPDSTLLFRRPINN